MNLIEEESERDYESWADEDWDRSWYDDSDYGDAEYSAALDLYSAMRAEEEA